MDRFLEKVEFDTNGGCWLWSGALEYGGYGIFSIRRRSVRAHRFSFTRHHGREPVGMVLHKCDVPACVNPLHLFEGDHQANMDDMRAKGRAAAQRGEDGPSARLTEADVLSMRSMRKRGESYAQIAARFAISEAGARYAVTGANWGHVEGAVTGTPRVHYRGDASPNAKLTDEAVHEIRGSSLSGRALATRFGVSKSLVNAIRRGDARKHTT